VHLVGSIMRKSYNHTSMDFHFVNSVPTNAQFYYYVFSS